MLELERRYAVRSRRGKQPFQYPVVVHDDRFWSVARKHSGKVTAVLEIHRQRLCQQARQINGPVEPPREQLTELTYHLVRTAQELGAANQWYGQSCIAAREQPLYAPRIDVGEFHRNRLVFYELEHGVRDDVDKAPFVLPPLDRVKEIRRTSMNDAPANARIDRPLHDVSQE